MNKKIMILVFMLIFITFLYLPAFSQETLTITTYYPSPFGNYQELRAQRMAIGDAYAQTTTYCWGAGCPNIINANADLVVEGNVGIGGNITPGSRLVIQGSGTTSATSSLNVTNSAGTSTLFVRNDGNVGIGTTTPQNRLDIEGGVAIGAAYSGTSTAPANGAIIQGNVGIGTTSPSLRLDVVNTAGSAISGSSTAAGSTGVYGSASLYGVHGDGGTYAVYGSNGGIYGVYGDGNFGGVVGTSISTGVIGSGAMGVRGNGTTTGVYGNGVSTGVRGDGGTYGVYATGTSYAGYFSGNLRVTGTTWLDGDVYYKGAPLVDFVFEPSYKLETIEEHAAYMWKNRHLKAVPSPKGTNKGGEGEVSIDLGKMTGGILEELEKAHIYIEQLNNRIKALENNLEKLQEEMRR